MADSRTIFDNDMAPMEEFVLPYIRRKEWKATNVESADVHPLAHPVSFVRFTQTGTDRCFTEKECIQLVHQMQQQDLSEGLPDIKFNFLVGWRGIVFEGRGWGTEADRSQGHEHLKGRCLDIAYIGDYSLKNPSWQHMRSGLELLKYGIKHKYIQQTYKIIPFRGHRLNLQEQRDVVV